MVTSRYRSESVVRRTVAPLCHDEFAEVTAGFTGQPVEVVVGGGGGIDPNTGMVVPGKPVGTVWAGLFPTAAVAQATFDMTPRFRRCVSVMEKGPETPTYFSTYLSGGRAYILLVHRNVVAVVDWPGGATLGGTGADGRRRERSARRGGRGMTGLKLGHGSR